MNFLKNRREPYFPKNRPQRVLPPFHIDPPSSASPIEVTPSTIPSPTFKCPRCESEVQWGCGSEPGSMGSAVCSRSSLASSMDGTPHTCSWTGTVVREVDGQVGLIP